MLDVLLWRVARWARRNKRIGSAADPYMLRVYLVRRFARWMLCLHRIYRSDAATALHNHPWAWCVAIPLTRGYLEYRKVGERADGSIVIESRRIRVGRPNLITHGTFHRVELDRGQCWTLFLAGRRISEWGFQAPSGEYTPQAEAPESRMQQAINVEVPR